MSEFVELFKDKNVILVSDADLDGIGSIIIFKYYIEPICKSCYIISTGDRNMSEVSIDLCLNNSTDLIAFTDIAPNEALTELLQKNSKQIIIVDHHESSKELLSKYNIEKYYYTDKSCATKLLFDLCTEGQRVNRVASRFSSIVNTYDFWQDESEDWEEAKNLNYLKKGSIDWKYNFNSPAYEQNLNFINLILDKFDNFDRFKYNYTETRIISSERQKEERQYIKAKKNMQIRVDNSKNVYVYLEAPSGLSVIANRILKEFLTIKYAVCRSTYSKAVEKNSISLRSGKEFSVKEIAEKWGGGGHQQSSGVSIKNKEDYEKLILGTLHLI